MDRKIFSQLRMTVAKSADNEMAYMFDATAEQTDGLTDWVLLGTLCSGGEVNLDVTLTVPVTLDSRYGGAVGFLDWQFRVEEFPAEDTDPQPPPTGDDGNLLLALLMICACCAILFFTAVCKRRKRV